MKTKILSCPENTIILLELSTDCDAPLEEVLQSLKDKTEKALKCQVHFLPPGVKARLVFAHGVYHREKFGDYELEIVAKTEEDLLSRLAQFVKS